MIKLDHDFGSAFSGVLTDDAGRVRALWGSYAGAARAAPGAHRHARARAVAAVWASVSGRMLADAHPLPPRAEQIDKEEREWCAGLPAHVFQPWVERLAALDAEPSLPTPPVR